MKFLCVPCDTPMTLQAVGPPDGGSLSVVYACPACGYEMAMLTNPYETQIVQSLGVRIGPEVGAGAAGPTPGPIRTSAAAGHGPAGAEPGRADGTPGAACPFAAMVAPMDGAPPEVRFGEAGGLLPVRWTPAAEARLANIPAFVRPMARTGIERFARERGAREVDEQLLDAARDFFGM